MHQLLHEKLRDVLCGQVDKLFDFRLALIEREIRDGWQYFHAETIWFRDELSYPLINDSGRNYSCRALRHMLSQRFNGNGAVYNSLFMTGFVAAADDFPDYINFLDVRHFDFYGRVVSEKWLDAILENTIEFYVQEHHRHPIYEMEKNKIGWLLDVDKWASMTPPLLVCPGEKKDPVRDLQTTMESDRGYWRAYYSGGPGIGMIIQNNTPDLVISLMATLAPEFRYYSKISSAARLVFALPVGSGLSWSLVFDKTGDHFIQPPQLILMALSGQKSWSDDDVIFFDVLTQRDDLYATSGRGMEIFLLYSIPRYRRLIEFYQPFVADALCDLGAES